MALLRNRRMLAAVSLSCCICSLVAAGDTASCAADSNQELQCDETPAASSAAAMLQGRSKVNAVSVGTDSNLNSEETHGKDQTHASEDKGAADDVDAQKQKEAADADQAAEAAVAMAANIADVARAQREATAQRAEAVAHAQEMHRAYAAHRANLTRSLAAMNKSIQPANDELEKMMESFVDHQAASQDKCPSLLLEAKHELNVLHEHIHELAVEINATEMTLETEHIQIEETYQSINNTHLWKLEEMRKCKAKAEQDLKMYWILKQELLEMHQIANPSWSEHRVAAGHAAEYDYSGWAAKHDFSAKSHVVHSTSSGGFSSSASSSASSTTTGSASASASGIGMGSTTGMGMGSTTTGMGMGSTTTGMGMGSTTTGIGMGMGSSTTTGVGMSSGGYYGQAYNPYNSYQLLEQGATTEKASLLQSGEENATEGDIQNPLKKSDTSAVQKSQVLVQQTKKMASELTACMANHEEKQALLEEGSKPAQPGYYGAGGGIPGYNSYNAGGMYGHGTSGMGGSITSNIIGHGGAYGGMDSYSGAYSSGGMAAYGGGYSAGGMAVGGSTTGHSSGHSSSHSSTAGGFGYVPPSYSSAASSGMVGTGAYSAGHSTSGMPMYGGAYGAGHSASGMAAYSGATTTGHSTSGMPMYGGAYGAGHSASGMAAYSGATTTGHSTSGMPMYGGAYGAGHSTGGMAAYSGATTGYSTGHSTGGMAAYGGAYGTTGIAPYGGMYGGQMAGASTTTTGHSTTGVAPYVGYDGPLTGASAATTTGYGGMYGAYGGGMAGASATTTTGHSTTGIGSSGGSYGYGGGMGASATTTGLSASTSGGMGASTSGFGFGSPVVGTTGAAVYHSSSSSSSSTGAVYHSSSKVHSSSHSTLHSSAHSSLSKYTTTTGNWVPSSGTGGNNAGASAACQYEKHSLQVIYVRAYVEITRLLAEYEIIIHSHACDDYVLEVEGQQEKLLEGKVVKMTRTVTSYTHKLEAYKVRIQQSIKVEMRLRAHILQLSTRCREMEATVSSLDKVRDAIHLMGVCPGLGPLTFVLPKYTGHMPSDTFDLVSLNDTEIDAELNTLCKNTVPEPTVDNGITHLIRAAEVSELLLRSIEGLPQKNTGTTPLIGTCPNCEGANDDEDQKVHVSGHSRVCWDPDEELEAQSKRTDCGTKAKKTVLCVEELTYADEV